MHADTRFMDDKKNPTPQEYAHATRTAFAELIKGYCNLHKLDDAGGIVAGKPIEIDGVSFSLLHDADTHAGTLFLYTGYGSVPEDTAGAAYASLLEVNLFLHRMGAGSTFAMAPGKNEVVLAEHFPLAGLSPELLDALLRDGARAALNWRTTYFLDKNQAETKMRMRAGLGSAMRQRLLGKGEPQ